MTFTAHPAAMLPDCKEQLWVTWAAIWNGAYDLAPGIISPDFRIHVTLIDADNSEIVGPAGLVAWIQQTTWAFADLTFTTTVGPIADEGHLVGQWRAHGTYQQGLPHIAVTAGTPVTFAGIDILRFDQGMATEYWLTSDMTALFHPAPAPK